MANEWNNGEDSTMKNIKSFTVYSEFYQKYTELGGIKRVQYNNYTFTDLHNQQRMFLIFSTEQESANKHYCINFQEDYFICGKEEKFHIVKKQN